MKDNLKGVGVWGQRHYQYLKENKPSVIGVMRLLEVTSIRTKRYCRRQYCFFSRRSDNNGMCITSTNKERFNEKRGFDSAFSCKFTELYEESIDCLSAPCYTPSLPLAK